MIIPVAFSKPALSKLSLTHDTIYLFLFRFGCGQNDIRESMELKERFENAVRKSRTLAKRPSNETLLKMYGLYKQGTEGDVKGDRPGGFDFKAIAKYDAWASLTGMKKEEAMTAYIELINQLLTS